MDLLFYDVAAVVDEDDEGTDTHPDHGGHPL